MKPTAAMEDYLEALLVLEQNNIEPRVKNLAEKLNIKPPSVIEMLKTLISQGYVTQENRNKIVLTETGMAIAKKTHTKHDVIQAFFQNILGVTPALADEDACKVEHCLSQETYEQLVKFMNSKNNSIN